MAKAKKNGSHLVNNIEPDAQAPREESSPESAKEPLTSEALRALFDSWRDADTELATIEKTIEAAKDKRSVAVKAIVDALGNKGPWTVDGVRLSVTERGGRYNMQRESSPKLTL